MTFLRVHSFANTRASSHRSISFSGVAQRSSATGIRVLPDNPYSSIFLTLFRRDVNLKSLIIDYLMEEGSVLKNQLEGRWLRFTGEQRIRLGLGPTGARALGQRSQNIHDEEGQGLHVDSY